MPPYEEALCSFIAAAMGCSKQLTNHHNALVIDQGGGSIEVAIGTTTPEVALKDFSSLPLGGNLFAEMLSDVQSDLKKFRALIQPLIDSSPLPEGPVDIAIAQGSVATKCAWLTVRRNLQERYSPQRVHGVWISTNSISEFVAAAEAQPLSTWSALRAYVSPHKPESDDFDRTVAGAIPLLMLLERYKQEKILVSAHSTRFGVAWRAMALQS